MKFFCLWLVLTFSLGTQFTLADAGEVADAARSGDVDKLVELLDGGAPVDEAGAAHPLHFASMSGQFEAARILIERGANVDADSALGTPLSVAAGRKHTDIVELLLTHGADPTAVGGRDQRTPLHAAAHAGAIDVVRILLDNGVDPDARTKFGEPALHLAVKRNHIEVSELLRAASNWTPPPPPSDADLSAIDAQTRRDAVDVCDVCHSLDSNEFRNGPPLPNVFGRSIAGVEGFNYSEAMKSVGGVWDAATLNAFLFDPKMAIPGNTMGASGDDLKVADQTTRWAIIAFLKERN